MGQATNTYISVSPQTYVLAAVIMMTMPLKWITAWVVSALCHECFHILALYISGRRINGICVGAFGARIMTDPLLPSEEILCGLAGPASGFLLLLFASTFPRLAICGLLQSVFNLFPVYPLDGSVVLRGLLRNFFSQSRAERIAQLVETVLLVLLALFSMIHILMFDMGWGAYLFIGFFFLRLKKRKIPCK